MGMKILNSFKLSHILTYIEGLKSTGNSKIIIVGILGVGEGLNI